MFSRERAARIAAETIAVEERKRVDQLIVQFTETQQAMLSAITALTEEVAEMLASALMAQTAPSGRQARRPKNG